MSKALYSLRDTLNKPADYGAVKARSFSNTLPKIIHQIAINYSSLPEDIVANIDSIKTLNPDWEYRYYDEGAIQGYLQKHYPETIKLYNNISPVYGAAKADLFRYLLLYNDGGVYLDLKSTMTRPLDEVLNPDDTYLLSHWSNGVGDLHEGLGFHDVLARYNISQEFQQWYIISSAGHPFLKAVIENVCNNLKQYNPLLHPVGGLGVISVTGPIAYTVAINHVKDQWPHRSVKSNEEMSFVYSIYEKQGFPFRHHKILNKHYTESKEPIVKPSNSFYRMIVLLFTSLRKLKHALLRV